MMDTTEEVYPGRAHDDHDQDDYDELVKVTNISLNVTPMWDGCKVQESQRLATVCNAQKKVLESNGPALLHNARSRPLNTGSKVHANDCLCCFS